MIGSMTRQFVPIRENPSDQCGVPLGNPAQYEEGRLSARFGENVEDALGIALNSLRQAVPVLAVNRRSEGFDLEIILDVDRHGVRGAPAQIRWSRQIRRRGRRSSRYDGFGSSALNWFGCRCHGRSP